MPRRGLRTIASHLAFGAGCLLLGGAGATLFAAYVLPAESMQDLGRIVFAMLLAALAAVPFGLALLLGRGGRLPRWENAAAIIGLMVGAVPLVALLAARV